MRDTDLKFPGSFTNAGTIRQAVAHAISELEMDTNPEPFLAAFLADAATKTPGFVPDGPVVEDKQVVLTDGDVIEVGSGRYTVRITDGAITGLDVA